ncbi:helicase-related protein [Micromonospora sp. NPDC047707]|uniref:helicase-related protein n=1 Tax=Micromonospora sp. NPDC047707 TaxID=3154498 RepID=UPI0034517D54
MGDAPVRRHPPARCREVLQRMRSDHDQVTVLVNARLLSEGIDMPAVDAVVFVGPRGSAIDAIQAVGRALRRADQPDKTATIILPVFANPAQETDLMNPERRTPASGRSCGPYERTIPAPLRLSTICGCGTTTDESNGHLLVPQRWVTRKACP